MQGVIKHLAPSRLSYLSSWNDISTGSSESPVLELQFLLRTPVASSLELAQDVIKQSNAIYTNAEL